LIPGSYRLILTVNLICIKMLKFDRRLLWLIISRAHLLKFQVDNKSM
jgi:hypothetical protein